MGASPEASPDASFTPAHDGWQPRRSCTGHHLWRRRRTGPDLSCSASPEPDWCRTDGLTHRPPQHRGLRLLQPERRPGHVSGMIDGAKSILTIFEHIHSRQFCVTDAHLPRRAHAVQIGGSSARSNAAVLTQCNRLASGPVLALIPPEAGMPAHADLLRGRIEWRGGRLKPDWRGRAGRERVAAWRRTGRDRLRMRASGRC